MLTLQPLSFDRHFSQTCELEAASYPADEAASPERLRFRFQNALEYMRGVFLDGRLIGFVNGTCCREYSDDAFAFHDPTSPILCIHSVVVDRQYRRRHIASRMLREYVRDLVFGQHHLEQLLLICKAHLVTFYTACGFSVVGPSAVKHGADPWTEMRLDCSSYRLPELFKVIQERLDFFRLKSAQLDGCGYRSQVDAFTESRFSGNPAAVVIRRTRISRSSPEELTQSMLRVASEMNLSETAFVTVIDEESVPLGSIEDSRVP